MVRQEERPWQGEVTLLLDLRSAAHVEVATTERGADERLRSSLEWAISATASIGMHTVLGAPRPRADLRPRVPRPAAGRRHRTPEPVPGRGARVGASRPDAVARGRPRARARVHRGRRARRPRHRQPPAARRDPSAGVRDDRDGDRPGHRVVVVRAGRAGRAARRPLPHDDARPGGRRLAGRHRAAAATRSPRCGSRCWPIARCRRDARHDERPPADHVRALDRAARREDRSRRAPHPLRAARVGARRAAADRARVRPRLAARRVADHDRRDRSCRRAAPDAAAVGRADLGRPRAPGPLVDRAVPARPRARRRHPDRADVDPRPRPALGPAPHDDRRGRARSTRPSRSS